MNTVLNASVNARRSGLCRLVSSEGQTFALDRQSPRIFDQLTAAAKCGFPRSLMVIGKTTLDEAVLRGETLSSRSLELRDLLESALRVPALFKASFH